MRYVAILLALALLGCGPKPQRSAASYPPVHDVEIHPRESNTLEVVATRRGMTGRAIVRGISAEQARTSPSLQVAVGRAWEAALQLITDDESLYATALEAANDIGTDYRDRPDGRRILDDTGQHLLLARHLAGEGDFAAAARTARRVLHDRMAMYAKRFASIVE